MKIRIQANTKVAEGLDCMTGEQDNQEGLKGKLAELVKKHRELDEEIARLHDQGTGDTVALGRLKREKLYLKDQIRLIEDRLLPDIIA
jgi:hypothetical protein